MPSDVAVVIGILSFFGGLVGAGLSNIVAARLASLERKAARQKTRLDYFTGHLQKLIELRGIVNAGRNQDSLAIERQKAYGEALGLMRALDDKALREQIRGVLGNRLIIATRGDYDQETALIDDGIEYLGSVIDKIMLEK